MSNLASAIRNVVLGINPVPEPEPAIRTWIVRGFNRDQDIQWTYDPSEQLYSAVNVNRDGIEECTGYGKTEAEAEMKMEEAEVDWFRGGVR